MVIAFILPIPNNKKIRIPSIGFRRAI